MKDLKIRSSWIIQVCLKSNDKSPYTRKKRKGHIEKAVQRQRQRVE